MDITALTGWKDFTPRLYTAAGAAVSASSTWGRYIHAGKLVIAQGSVTAGGADAERITLPVPAARRLFNIGTCAILGANAPTDQSGVAYMGSDASNDRLVTAVAWSTGFRPMAQGQTCRYSVTYEGA